MRIGFVGLGRMGGPMCSGLAEHGYELVVFDLNRTVIDEFARMHGVSAAVSVADVAARSEAIMISVQGPAEDEAVMLGPHGVLAGAQPGLLVLDATTIGVAQTRRYAKHAAAAGVVYLDTPVSVIRPVGGTPTLTFMVGGNAGGFERAQTILSTLAPTVRYLGPSGAGSAAKLLNQAIYVGYMTLFGEALALAEKEGVALDPLLDVLGTSSAGIPNIVAKYDEIRGRSQNRFAIDSALKYLEMTNEAFQPGRDAPVLSAAEKSLRAASAAGFGQEDLIVARHRAKTGA